LFIYSIILLSLSVCDASFQVQFFVPPSIACLLLIYKATVKRFYLAYLKVGNPLNTP
jgi:hypothetical protein